MFESYKKQKYSTRSEYTYSNNPNSMGRMCKNCGYPYGRHFGWSVPSCPLSNQIPSFPPVFYVEELNPNIKVL